MSSHRSEPDLDRFLPILEAWKDDVVDVESGMTEEDKHWSKSLLADAWATNTALDRIQAEHAASIHRHTGVDGDS